MKKRSWFERFLGGIGIGIGAAIPGVSGAAIALIFRIYETIIESISNFSKHVKKSIATLLPILIGVLGAVVICVLVFNFAFEHCMFLLICVFAGFLIGTYPSILNNVKGIKPTTSNVVTSVISALIVIGLGITSIVLGKKGIDVSIYFEDVFSNFWILFILVAVGIIASAALTVPGFSGSLILLILGFYKPLISYSAKWTSQLFRGNFDNTLSFLAVILSFGIGCLIGVVFISKLMTKLLNKHRTPTYFAIIGFVTGSFLVLFFNYQIWQYYSVWSGSIISDINPSMSQDSEILLGIFMAGLFAFFSYMIVRAGNNLKNNKK